MSRSIDWFRPATSGLPSTQLAIGNSQSAIPKLTLSFKLTILFLLFLYGNVAQIYPQLNAVRPALAVALSALFVMFVEMATARKGFSMAWPQSYAAAVFFGVAVVSSFGAIYVHQALETTNELSKMLLLYVLLENTVRSERHIRIVLWTLVIGGLFPAVGTIVNFFRGVFVEGTRASWIGIFANPNEAAYALVLLLPIAAVLTRESGRIRRLVLWAVMAAYLLAIFLTYSRGGLLGLFAVLGLYCWKQKSVALRAVMIGALVLSLIPLGMFWNRKDDFNDLRTDTTLMQRIATIKAGMLMFADKPLLGVGPGCSLVAYPLYVPKDAHCGCQDQLVIHNVFIQVLSETGFLGFVPFMVFIGASIFQLWKIQRSRLERAGSHLKNYAVGLELALWGFVACGLSGGFAWTWFPYILVGMTVATARVFKNEIE